MDIKIAAGQRLDKEIRDKIKHLELQIKQTIKDRNVSDYELAKKLCLLPTGITRLFSEILDWDLNTCLAVAKACNIDLEIDLKVKEEWLKSGDLVKITDPDGFYGTIIGKVDYCVGYKNVVFLTNGSEYDYDEWEIEKLT